MGKRQQSLPGVAPNPVQVAAGKRSKAKGRTFEQYLVNVFKENGVEAKRGWWQTGLHGAVNMARRYQKVGPTDRVPDVLVDGLWIEASTGETSRLERIKHEQAVKYVVEKYGSTSEVRPIPVAVVRPKGSRMVTATMTLADLAHIAEVGKFPMRIEDTLVTIELEDFIRVYKIWRERVASSKQPAEKDMFDADAASADGEAEETP